MGTVLTTFYDSFSDFWTAFDFFFFLSLLAIFFDNFFHFFLSETQKGRMKMILI